MKSFVKYLVGTAGLVLSMGAMGNPADNGGYGAENAPGPVLDNRGSILCTAAINSTGLKAGGNTVAASTRLGVGTYQITFKAPCTAVTAANGWARIVQVDTLTAGTLPSIKCITADRAGVPNAVWVQCYNSAGALTDTSFFLFLLR